MQLRSPELWLLVLRDGLRLRLPDFGLPAWFVPSQLLLPVVLVLRVELRLRSPELRMRCRSGRVGPELWLRCRSG